MKNILALPIGSVVKVDNTYCFVREGGGTWANPRSGKSIVTSNGNILLLPDDYTDFVIEFMPIGK